MISVLYDSHKSDKFSSIRYMNEQKVTPDNYSAILQQMHWDYKHHAADDYSNYTES